MGSTCCSRLFSTPHNRLVKKESVVRSHRKSISPEDISFARELIDVVDILTIVKIKSPDLGRSALVAERKIVLVLSFFSEFCEWEFGTFSDFWTRNLRRNI